MMFLEVYTDLTTSSLTKNNDVIPVFGPEMKPSGKSIATDLDLIKSVIEINPYDDYNYGIWFDTTENWKKE